MKKLTTLASAAALVLATAGVGLAAGPTIVAAEAEPVAQPPKAASGGLGIAGILLGAAAIGVVAAIVASDDDNGSATGTTATP
jgi:hypothetical protein